MRFFLTLTAMALAATTGLLAQGTGDELPVAESIANAPSHSDALPRARKRVSQMPKAATSADGFVEVVAADVPGDPVGFRLPILQFTTRVVREIERVYSLQMPKGNVGLLIHAQDGTTNDVRVITKQSRRDGAAMTHVWLPSPAYSNLEALNFAIAKAYLRCYADRIRKNRKMGAPELPNWFVLGVLRAMSVDNVRDDKHEVLKMWSEARLPYFPVICRDLADGKTVENHRVICGYIVSWLREQKKFNDALEVLARGDKLGGSVLAKMLTGTSRPDLQDRISDERLTKLTRFVLSPGKATEWDIKVFTSRLLLFSSEFDKNIGSNGSTCTFREAIALSKDNIAVREAAARKSRELLFGSIGRGAELSEAAESYRQFLTALARGEKQAELERLLDVAEMQMQEIINEDRKNDNR